jgi:hypothetical protein
LKSTARSASATERAKGFESSRHIARRVGMHRAAAALVTSVQRHQQVADLRATDFADDQPVRAHPQSLPHQVCQADGTS